MVIGGSVTHIANCAFEFCSNITSATIGDNVNSIGECAFSICSSITFVYYNSTEDSWDNITISPNNTDLENATRYYYSETQPTTEANYWHYVDGVPTVW